MFNLDEFLKALRVFLGMESPPKPIYIPIEDKASLQRHNHRHYDDRNRSRLDRYYD